MVEFNKILTNMSYMFSNCSSLTSLNLYILILIMLLIWDLCVFYDKNKSKKSCNSTLVYNKYQETIYNYLSYENYFLYIL